LDFFFRGVCISFCRGKSFVPARLKTVGGGGVSLALADPDDEVMLKHCS